jgi:hypothetical protein
MLKSIAKGKFFMGKGNKKTKWVRIAQDGRKIDILLW